MVNVAEALSWASSELERQEGRADASALLLFVLDKPRSYLYSWPDVELSSTQEREFRRLVAKRKEGIPVAHLTGVREFWSLPLKVNPSTLIPRPDTETLVEWALELLPDECAKVVDLGTGTGAIALAIASENPKWQATGLEFQAGAVALAKENVQALHLPVEIVQSDWFSALDVAPEWDLIVSNPPYIEEDDHHLSEGDVRFEPKSALTSGADGLDDIRHIIQNAPDHLKAGGWLLIEHGYNQAEAVQTVFKQRGFESVITRSDLGGQPRITGGQWNFKSRIVDQ